MPVPFNGEEFLFRNPDGTEIRLRGWGNQFAAVFETPEGRTVLKNEATGYYEYARLTPERDALEPSGLRVGAVDPEAATLPLHLRAPRAVMRSQARAAHDERPGRPRWEVRREVRRERSSRRESRSDSGQESAPEEPERAPVTGTYVGLCLLVEFPDVAATIPQAEVEHFCNQADYTGFGNNGSVRDYFRDVSDGKLDYRNSVPAYYRAQHPRSHYTDPAIPYGTRAQELIVEALDFLKGTGYDFSVLSADEGGFIHALNVFYAGDRVNNWSEGLWPHSWSLVTPYVASAAATFADYQITNMGTELTLRTFCHENGHMVCDFPDLYDYGGEGNGVGDYCLMCYGGSEINPVQVDAYLKDQAGWTSTLTTLSAGTTATVSAGRNDFLIHARNADEYFILENRAHAGRDTALPDAGLAIWHVDRLGSNNNEQMTAGEHYECSLEQADGRFDLERAVNTGDVEDLFGGSSASRFGRATQPDSNWWDGTPSGLEISEITAPGPTITVLTVGSSRTTAQLESTADVTGNGRADVVGFGEAGVWVSLNTGNGTFAASKKVLDGFGFAAGWRLEKHLRFLADLTGDGRADIVGFGEAGVWVSLNTGNGTFATPKKVLDDFGYTAGGWRVEKHPRSVAPLVQSKRGDLVGFGDAGVWVSLHTGNGTFAAAKKVLDDFGYSTGWRVEKHPRLVVGPR
jgi:M6 family metalloprotease-like protein